MKIKPAIALTAFGLLLAGLPATAQPPPSHWDINEVDVSKLPPASTQQGVIFDKDIEPLFKASCVGCHHGEKPKGKLSLDSLDVVLKGGRDGKMIIPGDSKDSLLVAAAARIDDHIAMPPKPRAHKGPGGPPPGQAGAPGASGSTNTSGGPGGPGPGGPGKLRPPPKPLTADEVGLVRAWIDQGAK
jgi:hypothetical protein